MARLPRLVLPGQVHWIIQRGISSRRVFEDDVDRAAYLAALREALHQEQAQLHAYALPADAVHLLLRPSTAQGLSRLMQALGRRYVSAHHRRHGGSGTLWDGRFRCAVVEPGPVLLEVLCFIDGMESTAGHTSLAAHAGLQAPGSLVDPAELWSLGNTPFDRHLAWQRRVAEGLSASRVAALQRAALGSWVVGSAAFAARVAEAASRPAAPRPRGRPRMRQD
jgi:putative transposase